MIALKAVYTRGNEELTVDSKDYVLLNCIKVLFSFLIGGSTLISFNLMEREDGTWRN